MENLKTTLARKYAEFQIKRMAKKDHEPGLSLPIQARTVKNVLVILPRNLKLMDEALHFLEQLKQQYPFWKIEILDIDKLTPEQYNFWKLPSDQFVEQLRKQHPEMVINLNVTSDFRISYLVAKLRVPYRVHLFNSSEAVYNIVLQAQPLNSGEMGFLLKQLKMIFV